MNEERNKRVLAVILSIAVIALIAYNLFFTKKEVEEQIDTATISIVTDNSRFYTVSSCVVKFFAYMNSNNKDSIIKLLSEDYKTKNNINTSNLYSYVTKFKVHSSFAPMKMYSQKLSKYVTKYYVYGKSEEEGTNATGLSSDYYLIVYLDESSLTFSIEPYDGEIFNK